MLEASRLISLWLTAGLLCGATVVRAQAESCDDRPYLAYTDTKINPFFSEALLADVITGRATWPRAVDVVYRDALETMVIQPARKALSEKSKAIAGSNWAVDYDLRMKHDQNGQLLVTPWVQWVVVARRVGQVSGWWMSGTAVLFELEVESVLLDKLDTSSLHPLPPLLQGEPVFVVAPGGRLELPGLERTDRYRRRLSLGDWPEAERVLLVGGARAPMVIEDTCGRQRHGWKLDAATHVAEVTPGGVVLPPVSDGARREGFAPFLLSTLRFPGAEASAERD